MSRPEQTDLADEPGLPSPTRETGSAADTGTALDADLDLVEEATARLLFTVEAMDQTARSAPSRLPGWTRADVVSHLTRNADAMVNLLVWAATGEVTPAYASVEERAAMIRSGAERSPEQAAVDLRSASSRFRAAARKLPAEGWQTRVRRGPGGQGGEMSASEVPWQRLREVEVHHVDLDLDYTPAHWSTAFTSRLLAEAVSRLEEQPAAPVLTLVTTEDGVRRPVRGGGPVVSGPCTAVAAWVMGRSTGDGLDVDGADRLPDLPAWG